MLAPAWTQLSPGAFARGNRDKRIYHDLFVSRPAGYISGWRALWLRMMDRDAVVFRGAGDHFSPLTGQHETLLTELERLTRRSWLGRVEQVGPVALGVHVRRGDFVVPRRADDFIFKGAIRTPLGWYAQSIKAVREIARETIPAIVVSDASDNALGELLRLPNVSRVDTGSAIGDLLVLSRAKLLIGSGGSTFSAWAAFLGQMPAVAYPGQSLTWYKIAARRGQYIGEWNHSRTTPDDLARQVQTLFPPLHRRLA
jgi:hypothetical protein